MFLFLLVFFSLYGGMHLYALWRVKSALQLSSSVTFSPILVRLSEKKGLDEVAIYLAWVGYIWMAVLFVFVSFCLCGDVLRVTVLIFRKDPIPLRYTVLLALAISLVLNTYGLFEAFAIRTERITIRSHKIKSPLKVVQISDVHNRSG